MVIYKPHRSHQGFSFEKFWLSVGFDEQGFGYTSAPACMHDLAVNIQAIFNMTNLMTSDHSSWSLRKI